MVQSSPTVQEQQVLLALRAMKFGSLQIFVQHGKIKRMEKLESVLLEELTP